MFVGALRLKQSALSILLLTAASVILVSCGNNYNQNQAPGTPTEANPATIRVHVFVSNPLFPVNTSTLPVLNVVDGQRDLLSPGVVSVGATSTSPGTMVLFPNKRFSFVFSAVNNTLGVVNNVSQNIAQGAEFHTSWLHRKCGCRAG
jgi:hypothetical protein